MKKQPVPNTAKIGIGLPRGSDTTYHYEFIRSLFEMFGTSPCKYQMFTASKVHHVARNDIIKQFLQSDKEYLLFIDSDMVWERDSLEIAYNTLQHPQVDIVTGIYFTKNEPHMPVIKKLDMKAGCYNFYISWGNDPFEVDGCGMGFMLIPRYVLEKMKPPYCDWTGGFSEDLVFCLQAKKDQGFKIWADPAIKVGHVSKTTITNWHWAKQHKPSMQAWIREAMNYTKKTLKEQYPTWREDLGIHPLQFKNPNTEKYWDKLYKKEGGRKTWRTYPDKNKHIIKLLEGIRKTNKFKDVLELGCGVGIFATQLHKKFSRIEYFGLDISGVAVEACKQADIPAKKAKIPPIDLPDKSYDLVLGLEILEHLDDEPRLFTLNEVKRVLKDKGVAIFTVPDNMMPPDDIPEHRIMYNRDTFTKFLKKVFKKVEVESFDSRHRDDVTYKIPFLIGVCR